MDPYSFILGVIFSVLILPFLFILVVSVRRTILDGSTVNNLAKKYIFITGCDSGFGFDLAKRLDSLGCHVIAGCLTEDGKRRLKESASSRLEAISLDVADTESVTTAKETVEGLLPTPDALWGIVNNAGIMVFAGNIEFDTLENMKKIVNVNLWGTIAVTKAFIPLLKKSKGRIVNVSSMLGRLGTPTQSAYVVSKSGVSLFSDSIRQEFSVFGVSAHVIEPGSFKTNLLDCGRVLKQMRSFWDNASDELREEYGEKWYNKGSKSLKGFLEASSPKRHLVVDCMEHALLSTNPKLRYFPGLDSAFGTWWWSFLPGEITDLPMRLMTRGNPIGQR